MIAMMTEQQYPTAKIGFDLCYLVTCSLHNIIPEQSRVEQMDLTLLYHFSKKHSLTAIVFMALEAAGAFSGSREEQLAGKWRDAKNKAIRKNLLLDAERNEILAFMEQSGIWYMPLKGIILKDMYPKLGMRQMADNDILYDKQFQKELFHYMTARGYQECEFGKGNHDVYQKEPIYNFEMHTALYATAKGREWEEYYRDVKKRLIKDDTNRQGYHFKDEDFYIYLITHNYKHYSGSGTGLRSLIDIYVFLKQKGEGLNWHYIWTELEALHMKEFEKESRQLSRKLFSVNLSSLSQKEQDLLLYYLDSGVYGTLKNSIEKKLRTYQPDQKKISSATRIRYYVDRLLPDEDHYINYAPFVYKHKWLIPFYLVFRVVRGLIKKRNKIQSEIQVLHKIDKK